MTVTVADPDLVWIVQVTVAVPAVSPAVTRNVADVIPAGIVTSATVTTPDGAAVTVTVNAVG